MDAITQAASVLKLVRSCSVTHAVASDRWTLRMVEGSGTTYGHAQRTCCAPFARNEDRRRPHHALRNLSTRAVGFTSRRAASSPAKMGQQASAMRA